MAKPHWTPQSSVEEICVTMFRPTLHTHVGLQQSPQPRHKHCSDLESERPPDPPIHWAPFRIGHHMLALCRSLWGGHELHWWDQSSVHVLLCILFFLATVTKPLRGSMDGEVGAPQDEQHRCFVWMPVRYCHLCRCWADRLPPPSIWACMRGGRWKMCADSPRGLYTISKTPPKKWAAF